MATLFLFVNRMVLIALKKDARKSIAMIQYPACSQLIFSCCRPFAIAKDPITVTDMLMTAEMSMLSGRDFVFPVCLINEVITPLSPFIFIL